MWLLVINHFFVGVDEAIVEFADFVSATIVMQQNLCAGHSLDAATDDVVLRKLVPKLRPMLRDQTPEFMYVFLFMRIWPYCSYYSFLKQYIANNKVESVSDIIWCSLFFRNLDRASFFVDNDVALPRDLKSVQKLVGIL